MKLIVLSSLTPIANEYKIINSMFEEGLEFFHINKPSFSKAEIEGFIKQIPSVYHSRIAIHTDFPKFHSLEELIAYTPAEKKQIAFLSPIFDSISKTGYKSAFTDSLNKFIQLKPQVITSVKNKNIIALGGVDENKIELVRKVGFSGAAVLGAIWNSKDPFASFLKIWNICNSKAFLRREIFMDEAPDSPSPKTSVKKSTRLPSSNNN